MLQLSQAQFLFSPNFKLQKCSKPCFSIQPLEYEDRSKNTGIINVWDSVSGGDPQKAGILDVALRNSEARYVPQLLNFAEYIFTISQ